MPPCPTRFGVSLLACIVLGFGVSPLHAQDLGGLPGTLEWEVLGGDSVRLITTAPTRAFAERALAIDEALLELQPVSLGTRVERIDVVVQPTTVVSNGFVGLEPYRSYLYAQAPQRQTVVSTNDWADVLAIHEYRHVEQYNNLNRGWTRFADVVFGDGGRGVFNGLSTPDWFFEGDAVYYETALTYAGRGRAPSFTALQRALAQDSTRYPYLKARNGSLRSRVPDHYPLGYALVSHGRHAYRDPWPSVVQGAGKFWPPVFPFSLALKRATGHHTPSFYREAYDSLHAVWNARAAALDLTPAETLTPLGKQLTTYSAPLPAGDGTADVIAVRRSQVRIPELVRVSATGEVAALTKLGISLDGALSYANRRAVWSELRFNPRRANETYSVLVRYDLPTKQRTELTAETKLFSPGLSPDGNTIVAVESRVGAPPEGAAGEALKLVYYDANSGERLRERAVAGADVIAFPRWTPDGASVVALEKRAGLLRYVLLDATGTAAPQPLTPWTRHALGEPFAHAGYLYYAASYTGIENVFRVGLDGTQRIEQLTQVPVAASQPSIVDGRLVYVATTAQGDPLRTLAPEHWLREETEVVEPVDLPQYRPLDTVGAAAMAFRERFYTRAPSSVERAQTLAPPPAQAAKPYRGLLRGFSLYTLQPLVNQTESSLTVYGGNILADVQAELTAGYNLNERKGFGDAELTVARTWPWLSLDVGFAERAHNRLVTPGDTVARLLRTEYEQLRFGGSVSAPVRQQTGAYALTATPRLGVRRYRFSTDGPEQRLPGRTGFTALEGDVALQWTLRQAPKHILPRGGVTLSAQYRTAFADDESGQFAVNAGVLLPGIARSHTLYLQARARVEAVTNAYQFPDFFRYARGHNKPLHDRAVGFSADYHLPLLYPDVGVTGLVYVRRVRAALWADVTRLTLPEFFRERDDRISSVGVDLTFDATFFNVQELPVGVRVPYVVEGDRFGFTAQGFGAVELLVALPL